MPSLPPDSPETRATDRLLVFELDGVPFGLNVSTISGVAPCCTFRPIPRAPEGVMGLAEWRGDLLTVLDLPWLLDRTCATERACLALLAAPLQRTAFYIPASVEIAPAGVLCPDLDEVGDGNEATRATFLEGGKRVQVIDPAGLVRRVEAALMERA